MTHAICSRCFKEFDGIFARLGAGVHKAIAHNDVGFRYVVVTVDGDRVTIVGETPYRVYDNLSGDNDVSVLSDTAGELTEREAA
jgi:hypothetical protein